jgi:hypothetical protein
MTKLSLNWRSLTVLKEVDRRRRFLTGLVRPIWRLKSLKALNERDLRSGLSR